MISNFLRIPVALNNWTAGPPVIFVNHWGILLVIIWRHSKHMSDHHFPHVLHLHPRSFPSSFLLLLLRLLITPFFYPFYVCLLYHYLWSHLLGVMVTSLLQMSWTDMVGNMSACSTVEWCYYSYRPLYPHSLQLFPPLLYPPQSSNNPWCFWKIKWVDVVYVDRLYQGV